MGGRLRINYNRMRGQHASLMEGEVPAALFTDPSAVVKPEGVSAVKAIAVATIQGQKIFTITQANAAAAIPQLQQRASVMEEVRNAINAGKEVTISQSPVKVGGWTGAGYTIIDPQTGAGAYMIEGGANGGLLPMVAGFGLGASTTATLVLLGAMASLSSAFAALASVVLIMAMTVIVTVALYNMKIWAETNQTGCFWQGVGTGGGAVGGADCRIWSRSGCAIKLLYHSSSSARAAGI